MTSNGTEHQINLTLWSLFRLILHCHRCKGVPNLMCTSVSVLSNVSILEYILSRASEVGSPTNHPGLRAATRHGARDPLVRLQVQTDGTFDPFLLRQGEPGTSQYIEGPIYNVL